MADKIVMPQLGESIAEGTIVKWLKQPGDAVKKDENILLISTDKVEAEIPAPASGVLLSIDVKEGTTVAVGTRASASATTVAVGTLPSASATTKPKSSGAISTASDASISRIPYSVAAATDPS